jgi:hypothetical protein
MAGKQRERRVTMNIETIESKLNALENQVKAQEKELTTLKDIEAIKKLQKAYGYYVEHMMAQEIIDCFSDSPDVVLNWIEGQFLGKEGVRRYFDRWREPNPDFLHQVMPIAGIIDVDPGGKTAKGRWYAFGAIFIPGDTGVMRSFVGGIYENEYIKEHGKWKILKINWIIPYAVRIGEGWATPEQVAAPILKGEFRDPEPDIPFTKSDPRYVSGYIFPFHYKHPVTGK